MTSALTFSPPMPRLYQTSRRSKTSARASRGLRRAKEVTRHIQAQTACELWARAAGRCQFNGCNRPLYKSPVTQERVNISEKAHIYSFSPAGPRGRGPHARNTAHLNDIENLMLVCHDCHKTIDQDKNGDRYSADLLKTWKAAHEARIAIVTSIAPSKKSHVIFFGAKIGEQQSPLQFNPAAEAMFPNRFPAEVRAVTLSMRCEHEDSSPQYWSTEADNLRAGFVRHLVPLINESKACHFSVFGLAPQPLLILLGSLLTDKIPAEVYQLHREPPGWNWQAHPSGFEFRIKPPQHTDGNPALIISLSASISHQRVTEILTGNVSIWELTVDAPHNDFLKSEAQLAMFRELTRKLMVSIATAHGHITPLNIFPAMPVACAVELGRIRMPKAEMPWVVFDQNAKMGKFIKAMSIGGET
jgi:5-methylcytosine-specific restriction endonuclease McrA